MRTGKPTEHANKRRPPKPAGILEDRVPADGEQVAHTLDPDRRRDNVQFPDPQPPNTVDDDLAAGAQSNAEVQMGRRTDAGPREAAADATPSHAKWYVGLGVAAGLILVLLLLDMLV